MGCLKKPLEEKWLFGFCCKVNQICGKTTNKHGKNLLPRPECLDFVGRF